MGFGSDDLDDGQRELLDELTAEQAGSVIRRLMGKHGWVGTYFQRSDVESSVDREITDEEWEKVQDSWFWYRGVPDVMVEHAWDAVRAAALDAGVRGEDDDA